MPKPRRSPSLIAVLFLGAIATTAAGQNPPSAPSMFRGAPAPSAHMMSVSTSVPAAEEHFMMGIRALDTEDVPVAFEHFQEAIKADPSFALAHLYTAIANPSLEGYKTHLEHAAAKAATASPAERLLIVIEQRSFANDLNGRLEAAKSLVAAAPEQPRALRSLAQAYAVLNRTADARDALAKAIAQAPDFAALHVELANSLMQLEPVDLQQAETHMRHALGIDPDAAYIHDYMGDLHRAKNELEKARDEYTRVTELNPQGAIGFQQRGHVNAFLGKYADARADYDRAIALATPSQKPTFMGSRALVSVYEGNPAAAENEINALYGRIDGMNNPNPNGAKIVALNDLILISAHSRHFDVAQSAAARLGVVWQEQARIAGTPTMRGLAIASSAYANGLVAVMKGDYATARAKAKEYMQAREAENNPRKNEGAHGLLGLADLFEGRADSAIGHFAELPSSNIYYNYHRALALEKVGRNAEAQALFKSLAERNFSTAQVALTRKAAASHLKQ